MKKESILQQLAHSYFQGIADDISNAKVISSIFPNMSDLGDVRENVLLHFLKSHLPSRCSILKGGCVFDAEGNASKQIDLLITNDFSLKFSYFDQGTQHNKSIQTVEGCLAAISVKSTLCKSELYEALNNLASIPRMPNTILEKINPMLGIEFKNTFLRLPKKILFAFSGQPVETTLAQINAFYNENKMENHQKTDMIIINNTCCIQRTYKGGGKTRNGSSIPEGTYHPMYSSSQEKFGGLPLLYLIKEIQSTAQFCPHILFTYDDYFDAIDFHQQS